MHFRSAVLLISLGLASGAFAQHKVRLSILRYHNYHEDMAFSTDTLVKDTLIDLGKTKVDLYFLHRAIGYPRYIPANGFFRNPAQSKECRSANTKVGKCCQYDSLGRVRILNVNDRVTGSRFVFEYGYDSLNRITALKYLMFNCKISYNADGTLDAVYEDGHTRQSWYYIIYRP